MKKQSISYSELVEKDKFQIHSLHNKSSHSAPLIIDSGDGVWLKTSDGRKILDGFAGMWNVNIGYGNKEMAEVASKQMIKLSYMSGFSGTSNVPSIMLAEKLSKYAYENLNATFFTCGGSEANDSAIKTARFYWKRMGRPNKIKIIALYNGFHGFTYASMSATGIKKFWNMFDPVMPGFLHINPPFPYRYAGKMNNGESVGLAAAREFEELIIKEGPENIGAFIVEPVQGVGGGIIPPDDFFPKIRKFCDKYNILLISDEVITGFGRTGKMFGLQHWGIKPDILSFAKGVTSGYLPLGGIQVSEKIHDVICNAEIENAWLHGYTYSGHATACAVAIKNIEIIERDNLVTNVNKMGDYLIDKLSILRDYPNIGEIRNLGLLTAIEVVQNKETKIPDGQLAVEIVKECLEKNIRLRSLNNTIAIAPPFIINEQEIDNIVEVLDEVIKK
jgi:putrescine---pyruvate transaminase